MQRSVAACLASILELDVARVPVPGERHPQPWTVWRQWLGQRGLGLVPIADPASFDWPGPWLAMVRASDGEGCVGAVAFGAPPGLAWSPLGGRNVRGGRRRLPDRAGRCDALGPIARRCRTRPGHGRGHRGRAGGRGRDASGRPGLARAGRGLEGDRYFDEQGTFSNAYGRGYDLTLIEAEVLDSLDLPAGRLIPRRPAGTSSPAASTSTPSSASTSGSATSSASAQRLCEPCAHLERLTAATGKPGALRALIHKGGLRADVLSDGEIRVGDEIASH